MSLPNPTPLRLGMTGTLAGRSWRVAGRSVMSMEEAGGTYCWNEFFLKSEDGDEATLVFETTETGGEWRLFTLFEPDTPLTAAAAAAKRVGDAVQFEGRNLRVTLVDESRVEAIEGEAPEGVEVGDVAQYFNAEGANRMFVVSWTGDEVECYRGADLTAAVVAAAFGLSREALVRLAAPPVSSFADTTTNFNVSGGRTLRVVLVLVIAVIGLLAAAKFMLTGRRGAVTHSRSETVSWPLDATGVIAGRTYRVIARRVAEIAQVGRVHERQEIELRDEDGSPARLVCGLGAADADWWLFTPWQPRAALPPERLAQLQTGQLLTLDGESAQVSELFRYRQLPAAGSTPATVPAAAMWFGLTARTERLVFLVLWNEGGIEFYRGQRVEARTVKAAFPNPAPS